MKKLLVPIVNRTNYSKLRPVLIEIKDRVDLQVVLSSSMIAARVGDAHRDIERDGIPVASKIDCLLLNDSKESMAKTIGLSVIEHASVISAHSPDALLIVGDRFDMLPAVIAAKVMNYPMFHIQGGERSGTIDDTVRDLITICSDWHYVSTDRSAANVSRLGAKNVFNFGCPAVEMVSNVDVGDVLDQRTFKKHFGHLDIERGEDYMMVVIHPNTVESDDVDMNAVMSAVMSFDIKCIVLYPNVDAFHGKILKSIHDYQDRIIPIKHAPFEDFVKLMAHSRCFIGNSSAGIRETASFGVPCVNIGNRQACREKNNNTVNVPCIESAIAEAIRKSLMVGRYPANNLYYKPGAAHKIASHILDTLNDIYSSN